MGKNEQTADLDTISIQFFFTSACTMYMVGGYSQGEWQPASKGGGGASAPPHPPPPE